MQQQHDWRTGWTDLKVKRFYPICFDAMDGDPRHTSVLVRLVFISFAFMLSRSPSFPKGIKRNSSVRCALN